MATMEYIGSQPPLHRPPLAKPNGEGPLPWPTLPDELKVKIMRTFVPSSISCTNYDSSRFGPLQRPDNKPWASRQTLAAFCLASNQLNAICSPLLLEVVALRNHREVMCFLRSLMRNHNLRARVRRLGYVCLARIDNKNRRIPEAAPTSKGPMVGDPSSWPITGPDRAMINMFHLGAKDMINSLDATQKALAVILAMLPRVEALFLTHGANGFGSLWPSFDMEQDPVARLLNPPLQSLATLEDIIVDSHSNTWTLWFLILNCRHLRRVVLKGPVKFDAKVSLREWRINQLDSAEIESQRPPMMQQVQLLSRAAVGNIQELSLYKSRTVKWDIIPKIFPDLKRLSTVFADTGWRDAFWSDDWTSRQPVRLPDALGQVIALYKSSLRSLTVTDALSDNEWTSGEGRRWDSSSTAFFYVAPIPPLLSPGLAQVPLVELTTDCAWLFGRDDTTISYQISSLLPSSLVSLHLIDYWAVSVYEEGGRLLIPPGAVVDQVPDEPRTRFKKID